MFNPLVVESDVFFRSRFVPAIAVSILDERMFM
jgi:hypothetical protein